MNDISDLLDKMWKDYIELNPQAQKIVDLFEKEGNTVLNDHIALRTFNHPKVSIDVLSKPFLSQGYVEKGTYNFEEKKLFAKHFEHKDPKMPKIFISELLLENFSEDFRSIVNELLNQVPEETISRFDFTSIGRPWEISFSKYEQLKLESEYGSWVGAIGFKPNHFTVFVNELKQFNELSELNTFLKAQGFDSNSSGGEIKGSAEVYLEQSSTLADSIEVHFSDKSAIVPSCYFEFAKRYPLSSGELYQGFVAKSADKIFESTSVK